MRDGRIHGWGIGQIGYSSLNTERSRCSAVVLRRLDPDNMTLLYLSQTSYRSTIISVVSTIVARRSQRVTPEDGSMATKITRDIIESYLNCKYKGHLAKKGGQRGLCSN